MKTTNAFPYTNRMGDVYYLQEGKTPTGKPKYYTGRKLSGTPLAEVPEGYEIYEQPDNGQVIVRKCRPTRITELERRQTENAVRKASGLSHVIVAIEDDALVVYTPDQSRSEIDRMMEELGGPNFLRNSARVDAFRERTLRRSRYSKMLRFALIDADARRYAVERWCFRGSIDDWIPVGSTGPLLALVAEYAKHLDRESFFELM